MGSSRKPEVDIGLLSSWCQQQYDSSIAHIIFEGGYSSSVVGVMLVNGNPVVVKIRPWNDRLSACWQVQHHMSNSGFTCPTPHAPPENYSGLAVSFEEYRPGGQKLPRGLASAT